MAFFFLLFKKKKNATKHAIQKRFVCFLLYEKVQAKQQVRATYSDYVVKKALQTWLIMNVVFNMVEAWKPACGETSQYIKSHETVPT